MRKYASKLLLDVFLSVVATVGAAYVTHHYFPGTLPAKAPVSAETTGGSKNAAGAQSSESAPEHVAAPEAMSDVLNTIAPATIVAGRAVDVSHDETAGLPAPAKSATRASTPARKRPVQRDRNNLKTNIVATTKPAQVAIVPAVVPPVPSHAASQSANPALDAQQPSETWSERDVAPPPIPDARELSLTGRVLRPIIRTVVAVAGVFVGHERRPSGE